MADPIDILDDFLSSEEADENSMAISDLDGFLTGVISSPYPIDSPEWLPVCLGDVSKVPDHILEAVFSLYQQILYDLKERNMVEPVFWQAKEGHVIAMDWCEGFMDAVKLRPESWRAFMKSSKGAKLMTPILVHMIDDHGNSMYGIPQEELDAALTAAADAIPESVVQIYREFHLKAQVFH